MTELRRIWRGAQATAFADTTRELDIEGAFRSGKTTLCLWRELHYGLEYPGIHTLLCRWSDDATQKILRPKWREICEQAGVKVEWNAQESYDELPNGSRIYVTGLKTQDLYSRYAKFRGLTLARVYCDQTEEIPHDVYLELSARLSQQDMPLQITISPNAVDESHWIAKRFPDNNREPGRKYIPVSIYTNAANLGKDVIDGILQTYPPEHPKHRMTILGLRGFNVIGEPVYQGAFDRKLHVKRLPFEPNIPLDEGIDFGKHHPCVVWRQTTALGNVHYLGGIMGRDMFLEDFLPLVLHYRRLWFPNPTEIRTACDPAGATANSQGVTANGVGVLRDHGFQPKWQDSANSPAVRLAMVERLAGYMRKRTPRGEMFAVNDHQWMEVSADYAKPEDFFAKGLEGGYVWDAHTVSVNNKPMRRPKKDGEFEHGQNASEYLELAFGSAPWSPKKPSLGGRNVPRPATWMGA